MLNVVYYCTVKIYWNIDTLCAVLILLLICYYHFLIITIELSSNLELVETKLGSFWLYIIISVKLNLQKKFVF